MNTYIGNVEVTSSILVSSFFHTRKHEACGFFVILKMLRIVYPAVLRYTEP